MNEVEASSPPKPQPEQRRAPPGRTPDTPPPRVNPEETAPEPKATPSSGEEPVPPAEDAEPERTASESLYGEDLPPDFWDSDPIADIDVKAATQSEPRPDEVDFEPSRSSPQPSRPRAQPRQEVVGKLTDDPRFEVMQSLFPGQIVEWQDSEEVADEEMNEESADDLSNDPNEGADGLDL